VTRKARLLILLAAAASCSKSGPAPEAEAPAPAAPAPPPAPAPKPPVPSATPVPTFTNVLAGSGISFRHHYIDTESGSRYRINPYDHGAGVLVADVNGDGLDDVYFLDFLGPNQLYLNRGGLKFENLTEKSGVAMDRVISVGGAFGDFDRDGDPDLYVTSYRGGNHLFKNRGDGTFEDVTKAAGVAYTGHSNSATWFDYDLDGDLDLYLGNIGKFTTETISQEADYVYEGVSLPFTTIAKVPDNRNLGEPNFLWRNNGDGTFTDVSKASGVGAEEWNGDSTAADFDLDGDIDLFTSNMFGVNHLYRNKGDGTFEDATEALLKRTSWGGMGCRFFDANGDEYPDLYVVDMHSDMWTPPDRGDLVQASAKFDTPLGTTVEGGRAIAAADETKARAVLFGNTYFENQGGQGFVEKSAEAGLETWWPWGMAIGDYNNDGFEDAFVPAGMGFPFYYWPNSLLLNQGQGKFLDVGEQAGVVPPPMARVIPGAEIRGQPFHRSSRSAAAADFDQDGDLDLVVNNFHMEPYLLRNDSPPSAWIGVKLKGKKANREGYGARVRVSAQGKTWTRQLGNAEGYLAQSSRVLHFGLGAATAVDRVEVFWPGGKKPQSIVHPAIGKVLEVAQP
jgi:hypothetical protein